MTDELLIDVFQGEDKASQHSVILIKGVEQVVQYRTCLNPKLTYTTLLNVLDGPFARTDGCSVSQPGTRLTNACTRTMPCTRSSASLAGVIGACVMFSVSKKHNNCKHLIRYY